MKITNIIHKFKTKKKKIQLKNLQFIFDTTDKKKYYLNDYKQC